MDAGCPWKSSKFKVSFLEPTLRHLLGTPEAHAIVLSQGSTRWWSTSPTPIVCRTFAKGCAAVLSWECTDVWLAWFSWFSHRGGTGKGCHEQRNIERQQCRTLITVELFYWFLALVAQWFGSSPWLHPFARESLQLTTSWVSRLQKEKMNTFMKDNEV